MKVAVLEVGDDSEELAGVLGLRVALEDGSVPVVGELSEVTLNVCVWEADDALGGESVVTLLDEPGVYVGMVKPEDDNEPVTAPLSEVAVKEYADVDDPADAESVVKLLDEPRV